MALTLTIVNEAAARLGPEASRSWQDRGGTIGRADNNDWTLPDPRQEISRCHARIRFQQDAFFIEDTSANGIFMADGQRIDPADPRPLRDGDEFLIGDYRIRVAVGEAAPAEPAAPLAAADLDPPPAGDVADPLALLGGRVEPDEPSGPLPRHESYMEEHFAPPRVESPPAAPRENQATPPSSPGPAPLLPDDWWRDSEPAVDEPAPSPEPPASPPPRVDEQVPAAADPATGSNPLPTPGRREPAVTAADTGNPPGGLPDDLLVQLLTGAGLDPARVPPELADDLGRILRVAVGGIMDLLHARMQIKNEFRMSVTLIQARENNPLKFSTSTQDALHNLLVKRNPDYLGAVEAFEASFEDLRHHQLALLSGMREAFFEMLRQFHPDTLESRFEAQRGERSVLGRVGRAKPWEQYRALFADIDQDTEGYFNRLFGDSFVAAYEKQMQELKTASRRRDSAE